MVPRSTEEAARDAPICATFQSAASFFVSLVTTRYHVIIGFGRTKWRHETSQPSRPQQRAAVAERKEQDGQENMLSTPLTPVRMRILLSLFLLSQWYNNIIIRWCSHMLARATVLCEMRGLSRTRLPSSVYSTTRVAPTLPLCLSIYLSLYLSLDSLSLSLSLFLCLFAFLCLSVCLSARGHPHGPYARQVLK